MKDILTKKTLYALMFWLFSPQPAASLSVKHHFEVSIGLFDASSADFEYRLDQENYAVYSYIYTRGMFDTLYPFAARYATTGKFSGGKMLTQTYSYNSKSRFSQRTKEVIYSSKGIPLQIISSKNGREKVKKVKTTADTTGTTDLQTVVAAVVRRYNTAKTCDAVFKVFDGKSRFDVIFKDLGPDEIPAAENSPYHGTAAKCSMYIDKLKEEGDDLLWKMTSESPVYFWIMEDNAARAPFIARIKVENTPLGEMNVYTTKIEVKK